MLKPWHSWCGVGAAFKADDCRFCKPRTNKRAKFRVFYADGKPYSSRSMGCACAKHLPLLVRRAYSENKADNTGWV